MIEEEQALKRNSTLPKIKQAKPSMEQYKEHMAKMKLTK